ncbi:MAG: TolC family protein [Gemmatimonadota bacterium]
MPTAVVLAGRAVLAGVCCVLWIPGSAHSADRGLRSGREDAPGARVGADTLRLAEVIEESLASNPTLDAQRSRASAEAERTSSAAALPEPVLSFGFMNRSLSDLGSSEPMTMNQVELMQRVPWFGVRAAQREGAAARADAARWDVDEWAAVLRAQATEAYVRIGWIDRAIEVERRTEGRLRDLLEVAQSRYGVGEGTQRDVLQAQVAIARKTADLEMLSQQRVAAVARLNALRGREHHSPIDAVEFPEPRGVLPDGDTLFARARSWRPALQGARARAGAAEATRTLAQRAWLPEWTVRLGYGQRPHFGDMASLMVGAALPVWPSQRQRPLQREAEALVEVERARERALDADTYARIIELRAEAERAASLERLYGGSVLPQAEAAVESSLAAYRVGRVDYDTLLDDQISASTAELERLRQIVEYWIAVAGIEAIAGPLGGESR